MKLLVLPLTCFCLAGIGLYGSKYVENSRADAIRPALPAVPEKVGDETKASLRKFVSVLKESQAKLAAQPGYTATFLKHEVVLGELCEPETVEMKLQHQPFAVYMKWDSPRRECMFAHGKHSDLMLVRESGLKGAFGTLSIDPAGTLALSCTRYPITQAGMLWLVEKILTYMERNLTLDAGVTCEMDENARFEDRDCYRFTISYSSPEVEADYRKSIFYFDKETLVPASVTNWGWMNGTAFSTNDDDTLVEDYAYRNVKFGPLTESDFDVSNKAYAFVK